MNKFRSNLERALEDRGKKNIIAPFFPTPHSLIEEMFILAGISPNSDLRSEILYDIGSGDGRIAIAAGKLKIRSVGVQVEIDKSLVELSRRKVEEQNLTDYVTILHADCLSVSYKDATTIIVYMGLCGNKSLGQLLTETPPHTKIVCLDYPLEHWIPTQIVQTEAIVPVADGAHTEQNMSMHFNLYLYHGTESRPPSDL